MRNVAEWRATKQLSAKQFLAFVSKTKAQEGKGVMDRGNVCETLRKNSVKFKKDSCVGKRREQERSVGQDQLGPGGLPGCIPVGSKAEGEIVSGGWGSLVSIKIPVPQAWHRSCRSWNSMAHVGKENGCQHDKQIQD